MGGSSEVKVDSQVSGFGGCMDSGAYHKDKEVTLKGEHIWRQKDDDVIRFQLHLCRNANQRRWPGARERGRDWGRGWRVSSKEAALAAVDGGEITRGEGAGREDKQDATSWTPGLEGQRSRAGNLP